MANSEGEEKRRDSHIEILKRSLPLAAAGAAAAGGAAVGAAKGTKKVVVKGIDWAREQKTGAGYVGVATIIFIIDTLMLITGRAWFAGLDVEAMMKNLSSISYIVSASLTNFIVLFSLFLYIFMRERRVTKEEFISFFLFVEVAYLCFVLHGPSAGALIHIGFAIYTWFMLKEDLEDPSAPNKWVAVLLFLDFFGIGLIGWAGAKYNVYGLSVFGNRLASPVWFLFSLFYTSVKYKGKRPRWLSIMVGLVIAFYILMFMGESFAYPVYAKEGLSQREIREAKGFAMTAWNNLKGLSVQVAYSIGETPGRFFESLIVRGAGPYYGYAEDAPPVGIFLNVEEPEAEVPTRTSFYAEVSAETLGTIESVPVSVNCWWGEDYEEENEGVITPSKKELFDGESETFRCKFYDKELDPEADEITFEVSASGLQSTGELPVFFIDEELRRLMKKRGEDLFFGFYKGEAIKPRVTYTNGPLAIKTTALNQPIGIGEEDVAKVFGIMLSNGWNEGEISSVKSLVVKLPKGVELSNCDEEFTLETTGTHNIYSFDTSDFVSLKDIDDEAFFLCDMTIKVSEKDDLIVGALKTHPRHVYINAEYDFKTKDSISIDVIGRDDEEGDGGKPSQYVKPTSREIDDYLQSKGAPWAGQGQCMIDASESTGVPVILMLALPVQERGWGGSQLQTGYCPSSCIDDRGDMYTNPQNKKSYNLFSIKGDGCWWETQEEVNKKMIDVCASFKNYNNYCDSINDFADTVSSGYSEAMEHKDDPEEMVRQMLIAGWATDSSWAGKVIDIMREINNEIG